MRSRIPQAERGVRSLIERHVVCASRSVTWTSTYLWPAHSSVRSRQLPRVDRVDFSLTCVTAAIRSVLPALKTLETIEEERTQFLCNLKRDIYDHVKFEVYGPTVDWAASNPCCSLPRAAGGTGRMVPPARCDAMARRVAHRACHRHSYGLQRSRRSGSRRTPGERLARSWPRPVIEWGNLSDQPSASTVTSPRG